jgi:hypothetical protein
MPLNELNPVARQPAISAPRSPIHELRSRNNLLFYFHLSPALAKRGFGSGPSIHTLRQPKSCKVAATFKAAPAGMLDSTNHCLITRFDLKNAPDLNENYLLQPPSPRLQLFCVHLFHIYSCPPLTARK